MEPFGVRVVADDGTHVVVELSGELDVSTAPLLVETLDEVTQPEVTEVEIRMGDLAFIDSTGLGVLVRLHNRLAQREQGAPLVLVDPGRQARKVLEITGLSKVFRVLPPLP